MNELKQADEFRRLLAEYRVSEAGQTLLAQVDLVLLAAPTSSGRNTIIRELLKTGQYHYIISDTTRQPRVNDGVLEQNGVEYWFRTEDQMLQDVKAGKFLEAAVIHNQQVSGISLRELQTAKDQHKTAITDIEIAGIDNVMSAKPDTMAIFVVPPSFDEWQKRLKGRGEMLEIEYRNRLESALREFDHALSKPYYRYVVNDSLDDTVKIIHAIVINQYIDQAVQQKNRVLVQRLREATAQHLGSPS